MDGRRTLLLPNRDRDARFVRAIFMRRAEALLERRTPGGNTVMRDDCLGQYPAEGSLCRQRSSCRKALSAVSIVSTEVKEGVCPRRGDPSVVCEK